MFENSGHAEILGDKPETSAIVDDMDGIFLPVVRIQNVFGAAIGAADSFGAFCNMNWTSAVSAFYFMIFHRMMLLSVVIMTGCDTFVCSLT